MSSKEKFEPHIMFSDPPYNGGSAEWRAHLKDLERYEKTKQIRDKIELAKGQIEKSEACEEFCAWREKGAAEGEPYPNYLSPLDEWRRYLAKLEGQPPSRGIAWGIKMARNHIAEQEEEAREQAEKEAAGDTEQHEHGNKDEKA